MKHRGAIVSKMIAGGAAIAVSFLVLGCWSAPRETAVSSGGLSHIPSRILDEFGDVGNAGRSIWWLGFCGGISILAGILNARSGKAFLAPVILGVVLVLANYIMSLLGPTIFIFGFIGTCIVSCVITYRAVRGVGSGETFAKSVWNLVRPPTVRCRSRRGDCRVGDETTRKGRAMSEGGDK